jgi:hypothetical protein
MQKLYAKNTKAIMDKNKISTDLSAILENGAMVSVGTMLGFKYFDPDTTKIHGSLTQIIAALEPFNATVNGGYLRHSKTPGYSHPSAGAWNKIPDCIHTLKQQLQDIFTKLPSILTQAHAEHMAKQAKP